MARSGLYHGWRVVAVCFTAAVFTWGFAVFGASVYLSELTRAHGWSIGVVSSGVTLFYLVNATCLPTVGAAIDRRGPRLLFMGGSIALACGVAVLGLIQAPWQIYPAFALIGAGYACLSVTGISTTIAPWFDRLQGRSVSIALMGASFGAIVVVPLLVLGTRRFGFTAATAIGALLILCVLAPLALIVLRHRGPETLGLAPDGVPLSARAPAPQSQRTPRQQRATLVPPETVRPWTRATAIRTGALWTTAIGFAFGLTVQVGFLTHHLKLAEPVLGTGGASWLVSVTGIAGLLGRVLLASLADRVPVRRYAAAVFAVQAVALGAIAAVPGAPMLIAASLVYGFCLGQITTLSPIVVRREFGAQGFGAIYGIAGTVIQLSSAFGPALYGAMRDLCGAYPPVLAIAAAGELIAMAVVLSGRQPVGA